ncbi:MAG: Tim44/TimA family putative adaptor protein [Pseudomonadota bacterium]
MLSIVIFAMVAAFLAMRLYAVLGKRTGHEQPFSRTTNEFVPTLTRSDDVVEIAPSIVDQTLPEPGAEVGLRAIGAADRNFNPGQFIDGAKSAYRMILEAFWVAREEDYAPFVSDDVKAAFASAIAERTAQGHVLDNRLVVIERAIISEATFENGEANITVTFDADIAAVTRDSAGVVIAGSLTDAVTTHDSWTFTRNVKSSDPNWILTDADESA